jgi:hypothetical protein
MATNPTKKEAASKQVRIVAKDTSTKFVKKPTLSDQQARIEEDDMHGLFIRLQGDDTAEPNTKEPDQKFNDLLEKDISNIFNQAHAHRQLLIKFFIWYTCILSVFVLLIVFIQIFCRIYIPNADNFEVIPQWVLYLLVIGMFGQFIGLLTIVTTKVWTFEPFFNYYNTRTDHPNSDQSKH